MHNGLNTHEAARALCSPCLSAGPAVGVAESPSLRVCESSCEAASLRLGGREQLVHGPAIRNPSPLSSPAGKVYKSGVDNTEVTSCCGTVPDRSIYIYIYIYISALAFSDGSRANDQEDLMEP